MANPFLTIISGLFMMYNAASCDKNTVNNGSNTENNIQESGPMQNGKIRIKVGTKTFSATLLNNNSAKMFKEMLPLTMHMIELNGNEKYEDLPQSLPTHSANPGTIQNGDLMLYGSRTLVLFYKTFSTSYSYTKLGKVDDTAGWPAALGSGNVTITFEKE